MISQAWDKHVADRIRVSRSAKEIKDAFVAEHYADMEQHLHDETFMHCIDLTTSLSPSSCNSLSSLVGEIYTNVERVMKAAQRKGHRVGPSLSLESGWDFRRLADRRAAIKLVKRDKSHFVWCLHFLADHFLHFDV